MGESCFQQKFKKERRLFIALHPLFNWQEEIQQLVCWPEEVRWQMVIELCEFLLVPVMWLHRSQHNYRQANPQAWLVQLTRSDEFYRYQFWSDYRWGALVRSFTGSSLYRLPLGAVPVKKPLQWLPVISPVWSWNLHQRPFHWWDCWGTGLSHVHMKVSRNPPSVVPVISPVLILEPSPEAFSTGGTVGGTVSGLYRLPVGAVPVKKPLQWLPVITPFWSWNLHQRPFHWWDCWGYRFQSCSDHRCGCSGGSPTRSHGDHWDPYLPCAEFWTGTGPVQATGRVTSQPVMRDTGTSSVQTAGCGHRNPARATG